VKSKEGELGSSTKVTVQAYVSAVCLRRRGTLKSAATMPLYLCYFHQIHNWVCSNYYGAMNISWKICSWFARHIVRGFKIKGML